jgi:hypothetical protein
MKLDNFKELLIKKADGNPNLQLLIKYMRDEYLVEHAIESLNKMARSYSNKNSNSAIMHFGAHMDPETDGAMIHDALSHHASHYRAALNSGNEKLADSHMKKIFQIMHMSEKLTRDGLNDHSGGKLKIDAIDPKPWERSGYSNISEKTGKFSTDTKGWSRLSNSYSWLRGGPHESYGKETEAHGHSQAYPLNQIKVNGKHLHIDDVEPTSDYVPHEFDEHPIMKYYKASPSSHNAEKHQEYLESMDTYGDNMDAFLDRIDAIEGYDDRGINLPDPIHKPLEQVKQEMQAPAQEVKPEPAAETAAVDTPKPSVSQVDQTAKLLADIQNRHKNKRKG